PSLVASSSFTAPPTPHIYTLSLHDALPILSRRSRSRAWSRIGKRCFATNAQRCAAPRAAWPAALRFSASTVRTGSSFRSSRTTRSEEHTSELQSRGHLVCRLLLEKKKKKKE